jgi:microcystin degradation protein MlrC
MRVAIGALAHEANSFSAIATPLEAFHQGLASLTEGVAVVEENQGSKHGLGGYLEVAAREGWDVAGTLSANAMPSQPVSAEVWDTLKGRLIENLRAALPVDGVLLYLHGAMIAANAPDAEGDLCQAVRALVGPDVPVVMNMDLHGNISQEFCDAVDAVFVYDTNPHVDSYERGVEAAECLAAILNGTLSRPKTYLSKPPMQPPTVGMRTADQPMRDILALGREWEAEPGIVNVAFFGGFPYADVHCGGVSVVVTATDPARGRAADDAIGRFTWENRERFLRDLPNPAEALQQALDMGLDATLGPVVLVDGADNPDGGGSADTTALLREIIERGVPGAVGCIWDPESVQQAFSLGVGGEALFRIAGKAAPERFGGPVVVQGRLAHLSDGRFTGWGPVLRGAKADMGRTARIDVGELKIVVTEVRTTANDRAAFTVAGVDPSREPFVAVKARTHFRADFLPFARTIIEVDAPGPGLADHRGLPQREIRRPIWPLDPDLDW